MRNLMLLLGCLPLAIQAAEPAKPNIVIFVADDCRYEDLGCYGSVDAVTPYINRLVDEGVRFDSFFQATAMSSPTRQCLMTGLYPMRSDAYPNHAVAYEGTKSIVHFLEDEGYHVALHGKKHINLQSVYPFEYLGGWNKLAQGVGNFLQHRNDDKEPFCMFVCSNDPHMSWTRVDRSLFDADKLTLPEFIIDTPETREGYVRYLAEINQLDSDVGFVDSLVGKYGFKDNTLFIFTSEHEFTLPYAKWTCYGQGLQTAFIARWPGKIQLGSSNSALCEYVDVVPTLIDVVGGKNPGNLDGKGFLPVLKGEKSTHKQEVYGIQTSRGIVYGGEHYVVRTVFDGRYRYILNLLHDEPFQCIQMQESDSIWRVLGARKLWPMISL